LVGLFFPWPVDAIFLASQNCLGYRGKKRPPPFIRVEAPLSSYGFAPYIV